MNGGFNEKEESKYQQLKRQVEKIAAMFFDVIKMAVCSEDIDPKSLTDFHRFSKRFSNVFL